MKVILQEDIKGVGKKGAVLNAAEGYARNYLLPRKLAVEANKANMNELELRRKAEKSKAERELEAAQKLGVKLNDLTVTVPVKAGENGRLFGSVTNREIAQALYEQHNITVDKKKIVLNEAIKTTGEAVVDVKLHASVTARLAVNVTNPG